MSAARVIVGAAAIAAIAIGAYMLGAGKEREAQVGKAPAEAKSAKTSDSGTLSPTVAIAPEPAAAAKPSTTVGASKVSALMADINRGRNYKAIHERLSTAA